MSARANASRTKIIAAFPGRRCEAFGKIRVSSSGSETMRGERVISVHWDVFSSAGSRVEKTR
jgi:hypothetical protein